MSAIVSCHASHAFLDFPTLTWRSTQLPSTAIQSPPRSRNYQNWSPSPMKALRSHPRNRLFEFRTGLCQQRESTTSLGDLPEPLMLLSMKARKGRGQERVLAIGTRRCSAHRRQRVIPHHRGRKPLAWVTRDLLSPLRRSIMRLQGQTGSNHKHLNPKRCQQQTRSRICSSEIHQTHKILSFHQSIMLSDRRIAGMRC